MDEVNTLAPHPLNAAFVPGDFAEKAMASLMQLHHQLMEEKERRVDLYRRLMEREQTVAELRMYVKLLEDRLALPAASRPPPVEARVPPPAPAPKQVQAPRPAEPPKRPPAKAAGAQFGWRSW